MIVVKLQGGLGNQMFQYATGRALSLRKETDLFLDLESLKKDHLRTYALDAFSVEQKFASPDDIRRFIRFKRRHGFVGRFYNLLFAQSKRYVSERCFHFDPEIANVSDDSYLDGYWNTEKYFKEARAYLLEDFTLRNPLTGKNADIASHIVVGNSVAIHIRRGDYASNPTTRITHGLLDKDYYQRAFDHIRSRIKDIELFIFSDDIPWVKENLSFDAKTTYVDWNDSDHAYEDLRLMSLCKHHIIANSTFSWWGAWLSQNPEKIVVGPKKWFNQVKPSTDTRDVLPESWIRI